MDGSNSIFIVMPIIVLLALFTAIALPVAADITEARRSRRAGQAPVAGQRADVAQSAPGEVPAAGPGGPAVPAQDQRTAGPYVARQRPAADAASQPSAGRGRS
jgi:hypothetical protein